MKHANTGRSVDPLLQSIAREVVERSCAVAALEQSLRHGELGLVEHAEAVAALAEQRRAIRLAEGELKRLGWTRAREKPLEFRTVEGNAGVAAAWQPEGTAFYRSLDLGISA